MVKNVVDSGEIGNITSIQSRVYGQRGVCFGWRADPKAGGGMLYDWGIHLIDQALMVLGWDVDTVNCRFDNITNSEVDDGFQLDIRLKSGKRAYIEVGTYNFIAMPRFYMRAKKGTALITDWREEAQVVKCKHWHESEVLPVETAAGLTKTMAPRDSITMDTYEIDIPKSDVHDFYRNFVKAIDGEEQQIVTHEQMMFVMKIMEAAFESDRLGMPVKID